MRPRWPRGPSPRLRRGPSSRPRAGRAPPHHAPALRPGPGASRARAAGPRSRPGRAGRPDRERGARLQPGPASRQSRAPRPPGAGSSPPAPPGWRQHLRTRRRRLLLSGDVRPWRSAPPPRQRVPVPWRDHRPARSEGAPHRSPGPGLRGPAGASGWPAARPPAFSSRPSQPLDPTGIGRLPRRLSPSPVRRFLGCVVAWVSHFTKISSAAFQFGDRREAAPTHAVRPRCDQRSATHPRTCR